MMERIAKKISIDLFDDYYKLKCDPVNIAWTGFEQSPDKDKLKKWFEQQINNTKREIFLFYDNKVCVGYCYIDYIKEQEIEESIGVYSEFSGRGIASAITQFEIDFAKEKNIHTIHSWISENNIASIKRLLKFEFEKTDIFDERDLPLLGGNHNFFLYKKVL